MFRKIKFYKASGYLNSIDPYGNGRLSVHASLYIFIILALTNIFILNISRSLEFFLVIPIISASGAAHTNLISSLKERDVTYKVFLIFLAIGIFGFTITEKYTTYGLLIFSFFYYILLMIITSLPGYLNYRGIIPPVFVISFLTILLGGAGEYYVAINRLLTLAIGGLIGYISLYLIPSYYYQRIWLNSAAIVLSRISNQLNLIINANAHEIVFHGECVARMGKNLGFTQKSTENDEFIYCNNLILELYFGIGFIYNSRSLYSDNPFFAEFNTTLINMLPYFRQRLPIPLEYQQLISLRYQSHEVGSGKNLYHILSLIIASWGKLCLTSH